MTAHSGLWKVLMGERDLASHGNPVSDSLDQKTPCMGDTDVTFHRNPVLDGLVQKAAEV